jgi:glycerophosphoryl diester phosphodiesterase
MTKTSIIGHRGAAGIALENTIPAFKEAIALGVPTIEFDVRPTKDGQFVVCHDESLKRISTTNKRVRDLTYAELREISLYNGSTIPLLSEVLDLARASDVGVVVEVKGFGDIEALCTLLDAYSDLTMTVASFNHRQLRLMRKLRPGYTLYVAGGIHPVELLQAAKAIKAQGLDLNYMLINPITYWFARRWGMDIMLYSVNNPFLVQLDHPWLVRLITFLYPHVRICTNHPERFKHLYKPAPQKLRKRKP